MTDESPPQPPVEPEIKIHEKVFPEGHNFSQEILQEWIAIPPDEQVYIGPISRGALDQFLFSISDLSASISELRLGLIAYSNGKLETADKHLSNSMSFLMDGETRNRVLFDTIIRSVIQVRKNAGK